MKDALDSWLALGGIISVGFVLSWIARVISATRENWRLNNEQCRHGVRGGKTRLYCENCKKEKEEDERREAENLRKTQQRDKLRVDANRLRSAELARLTKLRMHRIDFLLKLTPQDFEAMIGKMYQQQGYSVKQTPMSNDFGRDLILQRDGKTTFVECKRYARDKAIGRPALQKFYAAIMTMKAHAGIVVTTSHFAATAVTFAKENSIELIDGPQLSALISRTFPDGPDASQYRVMCPECGDVVIFDFDKNGESRNCRNAHRVKNDITPDSLTFKHLSDEPYCDQCGNEMRLRNGRRGRFWGCKNYPKCRGTKPYSDANKLAQAPPTIKATIVALD